MCFTYICKLSCDACWNDSNDLLSYYNNYFCSTLNFQHGTGIKMDDIYIYNAYTLSLLLACLQSKHRRGRLNFQEREDDVDMNSPDITKPIISGLIFKVNSINNYSIFYSIIRDKNTSPIFISCRISEELYKPRVKMRVSIYHLGVKVGPCSTYMHAGQFSSSTSDSSIARKSIDTCMHRQPSRKDKETSWASQGEKTRKGWWAQGPHALQSWDGTREGASPERRLTAFIYSINSHHHLGFRLGFCLV